MKIIRNPWEGREGYNCFGCAPTNAAGLQMEFYEDGEYLISKWQPKEVHQGYMNVLHGGIQSTVIDEIAAWFVYIKLKTGGVTSKLEVKYKKPLFVDKGILTVKAILKSMKRNIAEIKVQILNPKGEVACEGIATYFTFDKETAKKKLLLPEYNEFFND